MITGPDNKKVIIHITTYKELHTKKGKKKMSDRKNSKCHNGTNGFICSFCLNTSNCNARCRNLSSPCPAYTQGYVSNRHKDYDIDDNRKTFRKATSPRLYTKMVQTSKTDLNNDLNLLKEVLSVFQSKKQDKRNDSKILTKDVSVGTEEIKIDRLKLTRSKIFQYSIDENDRSNIGNPFKVIDHQPNKSQFSINLTKQKSSSIPQMKMEELRHSLKEKTRSKDAIEEVNRMFATVRKTESKFLEDANRPITRNGPRVLPVVKTHYEASRKDTSDSDGEKRTTPVCKCCQTNNIQLSAGDSFHKHECYYHKMLRSEGKCDKCVYMLCCHYEKQKIDRGVSCCECLKKNEREEMYCEH